MTIDIRSAPISNTLPCGIYAARDLRQRQSNRATSATARDSTRLGWHEALCVAITLISRGITCRVATKKAK